MNKQFKLYNVLFPFWMLMLFPITWLIVIPGNFIIDSLIWLFIMFAFKLEQKMQLYKKYILKIFAFGMLSDIIGSLYMLILIAKFEVGIMGDELYLTLPALAISAALIFMFNYFFTFKKTVNRLTFSLIFAIATAPYTFLIPSSWLY